MTAWIESILNLKLCVFDLPFIVMLSGAMLFLEFARSRGDCISQAFFCHKLVLFHQHC
jgi:hypothetical protein